MAEMLRFAGMTFGVGTGRIYALNDLKVTAETAVKSSTNETESWVQKQRTNPLKISCTVQLVAELGCDVAGDAARLRDMAEESTTDYIYIGGAKYCEYLMMLTKAEISYTRLNPGGKMTDAKVALTWQRAEDPKQTSKGIDTGGGVSKGDGDGNGGDSGGGKTPIVAASSALGQSLIAAKKQKQGALVRLLDGLKKNSVRPATVTGGGKDRLLHVKD